MATDETRRKQTAAVLASGTAHEWRRAEHEAHRAIRLAHHQGHSYRAIEKLTGVPYRTVARICAAEDAADDEDSPELRPPQSEADRIIGQATARGWAVDELERLIAALPDRS